MTLGARLRQLRRDLGFSQEALGAQGFVSAPGWIKIENGQRQASERLIAKLCAWLVEDQHIRASAAGPLSNELLTLKYLGNRSGFVRALATDRAMSSGLAHLLKAEPVVKPRRGRPAFATAGGAR